MRLRIQGSLPPVPRCADSVREFRMLAWCRHWPQWLEDSAAFDWEAEFANTR